jgi:putative transposase
MVLRKSFKFLLRPTKKQAKMLQQILDECRWLYNQLLEQRILAFDELEMSLTKYQQMMFLPELKVQRPSLDSVHSQVLQDVVTRLDRSFLGFFRRLKAGEKPGFPRFRGFHRYSSFCFPQSGFFLAGASVKLAKIGDIRIKQHREIEGIIKTCTLTRDTNENWYVCFSCEVEPEPIPENNKAVGIDVGLERFATLSTGDCIENPRFFKEEQKSLARAQKRASKREKGTVEYRKQKKIVAKIHQRIRNKRSDFCHKHSRAIVNEYQYICVEDLDIKNMVQDTYLAKSIMDASWNQFYRFLSYKAEEAGRKLGLVNPAYTSQTCSRCRHREKKSLSEREHTCRQCGYSVHRDLNSAEYILALGLESLGVSPRSPRVYARE